MYYICYGSEPIDGTYETYEEAEEAIRDIIAELWDHHLTFRDEYNIEEVK